MSNSKIKIGLYAILKSSGSPKIKFIKSLDYIIGSVMAFLLPPKQSQEYKQEGIDKILIIRPGGIGDAVFLLPIIKHIHAKNPKLIIDILCEKRNAEIFSSQVYLNLNVYKYDDLKELFSVFKNQYDAVIDTEQWHYLSAITAYFLKPKISSGFATRERRTKLYNYRVNYEMNGYELDNLKNLFKFLFPELDAIKDINACYTLPEKSLHWAQQQSVFRGVSLFLGASIPERRLTEKQSLSLIKDLLAKNMTIILLGGRDVQRDSEAIVNKVNSRRLKNFVGRISLVQSAALIKQSQLFIGPDSGLMHLACAVGTPVVAIFGPGNLKKWEPKGKKHSIITENVECSPCTHFGYTIPTCRGSYHCMRNINIDAISQQIQHGEHIFLQDNEN